MLSLLLLPYLGTVMATDHPIHPTKPGYFPCWIGPVFWDIVMGKELDIRSHADIRIECHTYDNVLPSNILKGQKEYLLKRVGRQEIILIPAPNQPE